MVPRARTERELLPHVDGVSLVELISAYEHAARFDVPGAYAGLVLDGEVGCWPLQAGCSSTTTA